MPDDELDGLFSQLNFEVHEDVEDFSQMDLLSLNLFIRDCDKKLSEMGELLFQTTQEARDLHSRRGAARIMLMNKQQGRNLEAD